MYWDDETEQKRSRATLLRQKRGLAPEEPAVATKTNDSNVELEYVVGLLEKQLVLTTQQAQQLNALQTAVNDYARQVADLASTQTPIQPEPIIITQKEVVVELPKLNDQLAAEVITTEGMELAANNIGNEETAVGGGISDKLNRLKRLKLKR